MFTVFIILDSVNICAKHKSAAEAGNVISFAGIWFHKPKMKS